MALASRPSILTRPLRAPTRINDESADREYQQQLAAEEFKRKRFQETEMLLRRSRKGEATPAERQSLADDLNAARQLAMAKKAESVEVRRELDAQALARRVAVEEAVAEKDRELRESQAERCRAIMEENKRLIELRRAQKEAEKAAELERERRDLEYLRNKQHCYR